MLMGYCNKINETSEEWRIALRFLLLESDRLLENVYYCQCLDFMIETESVTPEMFAKTKEFSAVSSSQLV